MRSGEIAMEESKPKYYNESVKKASAKYKSKSYHRIPLDVKNEEYDAIKSYAEAHGETVNGFIRRIIAEIIFEK